MFGTTNAKKPTIRRETVLVPLAKKSATTNAGPIPQRRSGPPADRFQLKQRPGAKQVSAGPKRVQTPVQKVAAASRNLKRKSATPERVVFSDDSSSSGGDSDSNAAPRKRAKSSVSSVESSSPSRSLVSDADVDAPSEIHFLQGADITSGEQQAKYKNPWDQDDFATVELQYPSNTRRESFELKWPKNEKDDYRPMEDITETIKEICAFYLPPALQQKYGGRQKHDTDQGPESFAFRFSRAWSHQSIPEFLALVEEFNSVIKPLVQDGTIRRELTSKRRLPLATVCRVLDQIYARTVSPKIESVRRYKNGEDNVYGELLPPLCSKIFAQTKLNESSVFVDLGSGVGNVVLQAALEIGCESYGIEMMNNPCDLADLQQKEFPGRTALWGLKVGKTKLLRGDFRSHPDIPAILRKADVVLVNNQAFGAELNNTLGDMFLDLKEGCKVASLKSFKADGNKRNSRSIHAVTNSLVEKQYEYFSGSVSWTDGSGNYYIATKDTSDYKAFVERNGHS